MARLSSASLSSLSRASAGLRSGQTGSPMARAGTAGAADGVEVLLQGRDDPCRVARQQPQVDELDLSGPRPELLRQPAGVLRGDADEHRLAGVETVEDEGHEAGDVLRATAPEERLVAVALPGSARSRSSSLVLPR